MDIKKYCQIPWLKGIFSLSLIAGLCLIKLFEWLFWHHTFGTTFLQMLMIACSILIAFYKLSNKSYIFLAALASICLIIDVHLILLYNYPFIDIGFQILTVTTDTNFYEILGYINLLSWKEYLLIFFCIIGLFISLFDKRKKSTSWNTAFLVFLLFILSYPMNFIVPTTKYLYSQYKSQEIITARNNFLFHATGSPSSPRNVLLIIGESHRTDYFLKAFQKYRKMFPNLLFFNNFISIYPNTNPSLSIILSRRDADAPDSLAFLEDYGKEKSLFSLFKEAGYETYYINYLAANHKGDTKTNLLISEADHFIRYTDFASTSPKDKNYISFHNFRKYLQKAPNDLDILPIIQDILADTSKKNFIVVKLVGLHFPPEDRYPDSYDIFTPSLKNSNVSFDKENPIALLNTYRNAMEFSVNIFVQLLQLIDANEQASLLVFVSDHGFCMYENGGYNSGDCKQGFHIPFALYANSSYLQLHQNMWNNLRVLHSLPLTQQYIFETIASLADISFQNREEKKDLTTQQGITHAKNSTRTIFFLNRESHNYDKL